MARVTIEKCLEHFANRFDLVLAASRRARQLQGGGVPLVSRENDKETVIALREIEAGRIGPDILHQRMVEEEDLDQSIRTLIENAPEPSTTFAAPAEHEDEEEMLKDAEESLAEDNSSRNAARDATSNAEGAEQPER